MKVDHATAYKTIEKRFPPDRLKFRAASDGWEFQGRGMSERELTKIVAYETGLGVTQTSIVLAKLAYDRRHAVFEGMEAWLKSIEARPVDDTALRHWLSLMARPGTPAVEMEGHVVAMKQWLWQVKRGVLRRPSVWHVAPVFWSKENGTGKSYNLRRLFEPLREFTRQISVDELAERFSGRMFAQTLICFLDEFAGVGKADVAQLKAILTGKPFDARTMHAETGVSAEHFVSCIATSNLRPPFGFIDETGARRFWSIHCSGVKIGDASERMRAFDAIDPNEIWRAVSADDGCPSYAAPPHVAEFMAAERERSLRSKTSLESFAEECLERADEERLPLKDFQGAYKTYCGDHKLPLVRGGYRVVAEALSDLGYNVVNRSNRRYIVGHTLVDFELGRD